MIVVDLRVISAYQTYEAYNTGSKRAKPGSAKMATGKRDAFTLSVQAEDYQQVKNVLTGIPDVRSDLVNAIRERVQSGQYNVSASDVADKILQGLEG